MSSSNEDVRSTVGRAEKSFREAFERLRCGKPERLAKGAPVSQNNVAKEAGCDPSALRKSRYPSLVAEIQRWVEDHPTYQPPSSRQTLLAQRSSNRSLRDKIEALKAQRDHALSLLVEADAKILDLTIENTRLQALKAPSTVTPIRDPEAKS